MIKSGRQGRTMSNSTKTIQSQFRTFKSTLKEMISSEKNEDTRPIIELDPRTFEIIKNIAREQKMSVETVYAQAIEHYISKWEDQSNSPITEEQKDNNPILHLDNLTKQI